MDITIKASDGKLFNGTNFEDLVAEVNAYDSDLKLKKEKEAAEKKAREEAKECRYAQVMEKLESLNKAVESYEKETGETLIFTKVNEKLMVTFTGSLSGSTGTFRGAINTKQNLNDYLVSQLYNGWRR